MATPKASQSQADERRAAHRAGSLVPRNAAIGSKASGVAVSLAPDALTILSPRPEALETVAQALSQAIARCQMSGVESGFTVTIDPGGHPRIAVLPGPDAGNEVPSDTDRIDGALEAARARGRILAARVLDQDDMLTADAFAERLGVSRVTVNARRQRRELLGLDGAKRGFRFPAWQVDEDGKAFEALPRLFDLLGPSPWSVYRFLTQRHNALRGGTAREALRAGRTRQVIDAAESLARGDFA